MAALQAAAPTLYCCCLERGLGRLEPESGSGLGDLRELVGVLQAAGGGEVSPSGAPAVAPLTSPPLSMAKYLRR